MKKKNKVLEEKKMRKRENKNLIEEDQSDNIETEEKNLPRNLFSEDIEENDDNNNENNNNPENDIKENEQ